MSALIGVILSIVFKRCDAPLTINKRNLMLEVKVRLGGGGERRYRRLREQESAGILTNSMSENRRESVFSIPFLSAAKMTDNIWLKGGLYVASNFPALSRVNDDAHYFSQAFRGWWLAYVAESAVDRSCAQSADRRWHIYPSSQGTGIVVSTQW